MSMKKDLCPFSKKKAFLSRHLFERVIQSFLFRPCVRGAFSSEIEQDKKAMIIQLADMLCHHAGLGSPEGYFTDERKIELLQEKLNLSPKEAPTEIIQETSRHFRDERHLYE